MRPSVMMTATGLAKRTNTVGQKRRERAQLGPASVFAMMDRVFGDDLHAKTVLSLAMGVVGVLHAASLGIHAIGRGMAAAAALNSKHATKQAGSLAEQRQGSHLAPVPTMDRVRHRSEEGAGRCNGLDRVRRR